MAGEGVEHGSPELSRSNPPQYHVAYKHWLDHSWWYYRCSRCHGYAISLRTPMGSGLVRYTQRLEDAAVGCLRPCRRLSSGASPSRFWQRRFQLLITSSTDAQDYSYPCSHALQTRNCQLDTDGFAQHSPITVGKHIYSSHNDTDRTVGRMIIAHRSRTRSLLSMQAQHRPS
jgi:hypothetical protein